MRKLTFHQMIMVLFLCMNLALPPGLIAQEGKEAPTTAEDAPLRPEEIDQLMAPATEHGVTDEPMNMK